mmetsp:Transcript_8675/g.18132  ORF Transcript_8675/g.18132 Transcript_8675/m.18132 type:complete len:115 (-) Transcript_8675:108-452(-)
MLCIGSVYVLCGMQCAPLCQCHNIEVLVAAWMTPIGCDALSHVGSDSKAREERCGLSVGSPSLRNTRRNTRRKHVSVRFFPVLGWVWCCVVFRCVALCQPTRLTNETPQNATHK